MQQNEETKPPQVKKEEPDAVEPKQEKMETEEKKPEIKTEPKEEEEGGANGSSAASAAQNRKKGKKRCNVSGVKQSAADTDVHFASVFKPEELRQALMPTLEALYRQDPESLPFRQPVDPLLLCIPVSCAHARTHVSPCRENTIAHRANNPPPLSPPHRTTLTS